MSPEQFHTLWLPLQGNFYRIAFYILENEADAKDTVQDLYLKLWNLRDHLDLVRDPVAYGGLMLRNLCIDRIRSHRPGEPLDENIAAKDPPDIDLSVRAIVKAMEQLPPGQRKLLELRVLHGLSYQEIEKRTGLSGLNIRVQVSLARKKLRKLL